MLVEVAEATLNLRSMAHVLLRLEMGILLQREDKRSRHGNSARKCVPQENDATGITRIARVVYANMDAKLKTRIPPTQRMRCK